MSNSVQVLEEAVQKDLRRKQLPLILFMLGTVDVGKTYTVTALANRFYENGLTVAVVDADVGQSDIGPPCCIGMGILECAIQRLSDVPLRSLYFVGNTSPDGFVNECVTGAAAAVQTAKKLRVDVILVDSTGWVEGATAKRFKLLEIETIHPSVVVAIEIADELRHIVSDLTTTVITLRVEREAKRRMPEERRALREAAYTTYFKRAEERVFNLSRVALPAEEGALAGLFGSTCESSNCAGEEILGLGILRKIDYERNRAVVLTSVATESDDATAIKWIKTGVVKLISVNGRLKEFKSFHYSSSKP